MSPALKAVIEAAKKVRRGCECDYDYRCSYCSRVVSLQLALARLEDETK